MYRIPSTFKHADIAATRSRYDWNERFLHWERPASRSEEDKIERAARMVRDALAGRELLGAPLVEVNAQGSYFNNTNTRIESDMDIRADWRGECEVVTDFGLSKADAFAGLSLVPIEQPVREIHAGHRVRVWLALCDAFGTAHVKPTGKCLKLMAVPNSRAPADVVPTIRCLYAVPRGQGLLSVVPVEFEGVAIYDLDGERTINFPAQHHFNGKQKHADTRRRFKKAVRILKCLRDELVELGMLKDGQIPSFFIECLVHLAPASVFLVDEDRYDRVRRLLLELDTLWRDAQRCRLLTEVNGIKPLFEPFMGRPQPWSVGDARQFVVAAWKRMES